VPERVFESKKDWWLVALVWVALAAGPVIVLASAVVDWPGWPTFLWVFGLCMVGPAIVVGLAFPVRYVVQDETLLIRAGLVLRWRVPIDGIERIEPTRNPLSSPAWSLDRIRISYRSDGGGPKDIMISPEPRDAFYQALIDRNVELQRTERGIESRQEQEARI
jgi:membrane protein YdbS with pleckstrin-like domain